ncbi:hypothetical protein [Sanguibacter antarcticus]|uniref:Uncharacterized protein n=1 Tax=Sanguibacter antarcticus TaxID=372484 RepID=A0A2A9E9E7_9MICO|nr:hypothetical protein [Sanguibacter antarcticus]PFG34925.1 hypothetical protein ATL42_2856 [Sanguibacter antarcticus]
MSSRGTSVLGTPSRASRATHGFVAAAFSTFVALLSHVLAGGTVPGILGIAVPLLLATSACVALAGLRRSWLRLTGSVALSQILFHTLFVLGTTGTAQVVGDGGLHAGHDAQSALVVLSSTTGSMAHAGHSAGWMWLAHALAGVVTIVVLQRGEAVLSRLTRLSSRVAAFLLPPVVRVAALPAHPRTALASAAGTWVPVALPVMSSGVVRRGPPVLSLV